MASGMTADWCNSVTSAPAFRLQAIDSLTGLASIDGFVATCWPGSNVVFVAPCCTATSPSMTATREPSSPALTRKTVRSEEHTSELQSLAYLVCRLLLEKKKKNKEKEHKSQ